MKTEYLIQKSKPVIYQNNEEHYIEPYFYVKYDDDVPQLPEIVRVEDTDKTSLYGDKIKRIITKLPKDVGNLRTMFDWTGEADIMFRKRFNIDNGVIQNNSNKIYLDIELAVKKGENPDFTGNYPVTLICIYNEIKNEYHQWVFHPKLFVKSINTSWKNRYTDSETKRVIHQFSHEKRMLLDFLSYIKYFTPDVIIEWSLNPFDMANILARMDFHDIDYKQISPLNVVRTGDRIDVYGIECVSMLNLYKKSYIGEVPGLSLDNVCEKEFGANKLMVIDDYFDFWMNNVKDMLDYNCADVEMMVNLNKVVELFDNIQYIIDYIGCELNDYLSSTSLVKHFMLKKANEYGVVLDTWKRDNIISFNGYDENYFNLPNVTLLEYRKDFNCGLVLLSEKFKSKQEERKYMNNINKRFNIEVFSIKGGYVLSPKCGLHDNVDLFDFKSMYPNIIIEKNMSPETLVKYDDVHKYNKEDLHDIGNGVYFLRQHVKVGFLPKVLIGLFDMRDAIKKKMVGLDPDSQQYKILDMQQTGIKYIINSFYGVMKFICIHIAESTTFFGRKLVKFIIKKSEEFGCKVLYGDTDSIYINGADDSFATRMMEAIKVEFGVTIDLEHENHLKRALFITKKKYILQKDDGKYIYKGIEIKRGNEPKLIKEAQKKIIDMLFNDVCKDDIIKYLRTEIEDIINMPPTYVARRVRLNFNRKTKNKVTKYEIAANKRPNKHYKTGDKPYYLPGICFDNDDEATITNNMLSDLKDEYVKKMQLIFNGLDWDVSDIKNKYVQQRIEI